MHPAILLQNISALLQTERLAHLGPERRPGGLPISLLDERLESAFKDVRLNPALTNLFRSIVYLWHDHLVEAHTLAQEIETQDGSLVHGIMHRREPDYGNAKYWFRRAGIHPSFHSLALKARDLLQKHTETDLLSRLLPNNTWDPFAFVDAVEDSEEGQFKSAVETLEQLQKFEFESLIENLVNRV